MKEPDYQWRGAQGCEWWKLDVTKDKFTDNEHELIIKINENFVIHALITKKWYGICYWSKIYINDIFYNKSCEHVDEDLYWLLEKLEKLVFIQDIKKNKVKTTPLKRFNKKKEKIFSKANIKIFTMNEEIKSPTTLTLFG